MKGPKKGFKQSQTHIDKRVKTRTKWNGGHNLLTTQKFLDKLIEKWPNCPYDTSKVEYVKSDVKIQLICSTHGEFLKWPSDILNHSGCAKCSGNGFSKEHYLQELKIKFPEYNFDNSEYRNATTNMEIVCNEHGKFYLSRNALLNGVRCIHCTNLRLAKERIKSGRAIDPSELTAFERYKREVWKETNKSYKKHKEVLGTRNRKNHLDHNYSILQGFRDNISPSIIGNIVNLRIIEATINQSKNTKCNISKEELLNLYERKND